VQALQGLQALILIGLQLIVFALCVVGLVDAARRPATAFTSAGKRTKNFWLVVLGIATAISFVSIGGMRFLFLAILAGVAATVYLVDVKPAIAPYSGGGRGQQSRGGW
jgi:hypothetical protein